MENINRETDYWQWVYYITRLWDYPNGVSAKLIGFAVIMSTFGNHGHDIRPSAATLSKRANLPARPCGHLRQECIRLGLFRETDKSWAGIPVLEITIPASSAKAYEPKAAERDDDDTAAYPLAEAVPRQAIPDDDESPAYAVKRPWD